MRDLRHSMTLRRKNCLGTQPFSGRLAAGAAGPTAGAVEQSGRGGWGTHRGLFGFTQLLRSPGVRVDGELLYGALGKSRGVRSYCLHIYSSATSENMIVFVIEKNQ